MMIIEHGTWTAYVPSDLSPDDVSYNILFCRRSSDEVDWYDYVRWLQDNPASIFLAVGADTNQVMVATRDATKIFPQGCTLLEITDYAGADPQSEYGGRVYDEANSVILPLDTPPPVPMTVSKLGLKRALAELGLWDTVKNAIASDPDIQEEWDLAIEVHRLDPLTQRIIQMLEFDPAQVDALIVRAHILVNP